jgi:hypothetical protein
MIKTHIENASGHKVCRVWTLLLLLLYICWGVFAYGDGERRDLVDMMTMEEIRDHEEEEEGSSSSLVWL